MNNSIFGHVESSLNGYLADPTRRGESASLAAAIQLAHGELPRGGAAPQAVLDERRPDDRCHCPTCRKRLFSHAPAPCRVYLAAHPRLLAGEDDQPYRTNTPGLSTR